MSDIDTKGWSESELKALADMKAELAQEQGKLSDLEAKDAAYKASAAYQIAQLKAEKERVQREREARELEALGEAELLKAQATHGADKVLGLRTLRGYLILRTPKQAELDALNLRLESIESKSAQEKLWKGFTADLAVYPERKRFVEICDEFPGTWEFVGRLRDTLSHAVREATEKKD